MARKAERIFELYRQNLNELSEYKNWTAFLRSAAWQYKYSFADQVSIFAQRPDATACASMDVWKRIYADGLTAGPRESRCCGKTAAGII